MNFIFSCSTRYLTCSLCSLMRYRVEHSKIKFISTRRHVISSIYYIKVSGILSGNKLIKTIRYPHMWRYDIFTCEDIDDFSDINFVSLIVLKFVGVSSKHLRIFLERPRESSEIFGHLWEFLEIHRKCSGMFIWPLEQFWKIFRNLWKVVGNPRKVVGNLRKIVKNVVIGKFI